MAEQEKKLCRDCRRWKPLHEFRTPPKDAGRRRIYMRPTNWYPAGHPKEETARREFAEAVWAAIQQLVRESEPSDICKTCHRRRTDPAWGATP